MKSTPASSEKSGRIIGLARVSTGDQNCDLQVNALRAFGCDDIIVEKGISGGIHPKDRDGFNSAREKLGSGDTLVVWKIDRLGRSLKGILDTIDELHQSNIHFISLTENFSTDSAMGRAMMQIFGVIAQLERDLISERTIAGLVAARARGVKLGPRYKLTDEQVIAAHVALHRDATTILDIAYDLGVSRQTLSRGLQRIRTRRGISS